MGSGQLRIHTYTHTHVAKVVQSRMANHFQIFPPLVFSYRLFIFTNRGNFQSRTEFEESLPRKTASKRGLDRSQMEQPIKKNKFSYFARSRLRLRPQEIWERDCSNLGRELNCPCPLFSARSCDAMSRVRESKSKLELFTGRLSNVFAIFSWP